MMEGLSRIFITHRECQNRIVGASSDTVWKYNQQSKDERVIVLLYVTHCSIERIIYMLLDIQCYDRTLKYST